MQSPRLKGIPPTITRIFASTQIPITPCTNVQKCSSEDGNRLSFWPGKRSIKSPNTSFVYILLTPHLKSNVNHSLSQIPKHKYVKRRKILNQFVKKFLWFFFISATTRIAVTTLMGWVGPFKASLFPFHLSLIVQLFRTRILIACCLQGSQRENRYVQYSSSGARFVNVDRHQTQKN